MSVSDEIVHYSSLTVEQLNEPLIFQDENERIEVHALLRDVPLSEFVDKPANEVHKYAYVRTYCETVPIAHHGTIYYPPYETEVPVKKFVTGVVCGKTIFCERVPTDNSLTNRLRTKTQEHKAAKKITEWMANLPDLPLE